MEFIVVGVTYLQSSVLSEQLFSFTRLGHRIPGENGVREYIEPELITQFGEE